MAKLANAVQKGVQKKRHTYVSFLAYECDVMLIMASILDKGLTTCVKQVDLNETHTCLAHGGSMSRGGPFVGKWSKNRENRADIRQNSTISQATHF